MANSKDRQFKRTASYISGEPLEDRLIKAAFENNLSVVKEMIENHKVDINGNESPNALGWALQNANQDMVNYLISKGADPKCQHCIAEKLEDIVCLMPNPGGFELTMRINDYKLEAENPQRCLELYCQEASLTNEILQRLITLGADIHCCNDYPLHVAVSDDADGYREPQKIANTVAVLRDHGACMTAKSLNLTADIPLNIALRNNFIDACKEILKGYSEEELCFVVRTHKEKEAVKLAEAEIRNRLKKFPDSILDRYKERASTHLPEFLRFAEKEFSKRNSKQLMSKMKKLTHSENTLEI